MQQNTNIKLKWDLSVLLTDESEKYFTQQLKEIEEQNFEFINKWKERTDYLENPAILKTVLYEYDKLCTTPCLSGSVGYYDSLKSSLDQSNPQLKARLARLDDAATKLVNELEFFTHRLSKVDAKTQETFLSNPSLAEYKQFLKQLFTEAKYLLSEPEEKVINITSTTSHAYWVRMTSDLLSREEKMLPDSEGKKTKKSFAEIVKLMNDKNKDVRDAAAKAFNEILAKHVDTAENELNAILQHKKAMDKLRGFTRPDAARLLGDDMPIEAVDSMREAVTGRFDISAKYYQHKAQLLGVPKLAYHERNVEIGTFGSEKYTFDDATKLIGKTLNRLDPEFKNIFDSFLKNGQIDVYPVKGKTDGAFCAHNLKVYPTYVLLNYNERLRDVTTLAHEMGHAINNELTRKKQNAINFGVFTSTAEVASTFFEDFILEELERDLSAQDKQALEVERMNDFVSTVLRQVACYNFELELHNNFRETGYLSKNDIGKLFQKHMAAYMGPYVKQSTGSENWWVYWSHIRSFFYVYSYASGLLISKSLQNMVRTNPKDVTKVKEFLSSGTSDSPANLFFKMGIDIKGKDFWTKALKATN